MEVAVGSKRGPKVNATRAAFTDAFAPQTIMLLGFEVESGVSSHPVTAEETMLGAMNRVIAARHLQPGADFFVGIEGGLQLIHLPNGEKSYFEASCVVIENSRGEQGLATSSGVQIRGKILEAILAGEELSLAMHRMHGLENLGSLNGFYGVASNDLVTRESSYYDAVVHALGPFLHPEYFA